MVDGWGLEEYGLQGVVTFIALQVRGLVMGCGCALYPQPLPRVAVFTSPFLTPSQGTTLLGLLVAVVWQASRLRGSPNQTWLGLDLKGAFTGWGEFLRYALPAAIMICLEW